MSTHLPSPQADLGDLRGLTTGLDGRNASMIDGGEFDGAKAYKDSKARRGASWGPARAGCCVQRAAAASHPPLQLAGVRSAGAPPADPARRCSTPHPIRCATC